MSERMCAKFRPLTATALVAALYWLAQPPAIADRDLKGLADPFQFSQVLLPEVPGPRPVTSRAVHPGLGNHAAWVSAVGAAVALADLDRDGLPNDVCYVDTCTNQVILAPAPVPLTAPGGRAAARYTPFVLRPDPALPYDPETTAPMGCVCGDFNDDGYPDVLVYYWGRTPVVFLGRPGAAYDLPTALTAEAVTPVELVAPGSDGNPERWFTNAITQADVDGDGLVDLTICNYYQDGSEILNRRASSQVEMQDSMTHAFNGGSKHFLLRGRARASDRVNFRACRPTFVGPDGEPVSAAVAAAIDRGWTLAIAAADLDGDLRPEFYLANDFGPDRLLHNRSSPGQLNFGLLEGERHFSTPKSKALGRDIFKGMGAEFADVDGDGRLDILVSNIAAEWALQESHFTFIRTGGDELMREGVAPFEDQSEALGLSRGGWGWDVRAGDFNNDGRLEVLRATGFAKGGADRWAWLHELATANDNLLRRPGAWMRFRPGIDGLSGDDRMSFYTLGAGARFWDVAPLRFEKGTVGRGIATADVDGDGWLDFAVANQWNRSSFFYNGGGTYAPSGGGRHGFVGLRLVFPVAAGAMLAVGVGDNVAVVAGDPPPARLTRSAIGAAVSILLPDGRRLVAQVDGGNGHSGRRSPDVHFGLSDIATGTPLHVQIAWRDPAGSECHARRTAVAGQWQTVYLGTSEASGNSHAR